MKMNEANLLDGDSFTTNNYWENNNYVDLKPNQQENSEQYNTNAVLQQEEKGAFDFDFTPKQVVNQTKAMFEKAQEKVKETMDSLI